MTVSSNHPVCIKGSNEPYQSKDLGLGTRRTGFTPPFATCNAPSEQFDPTTQAQAFRFVKNDVDIELQHAHTVPWITVKGITRKFYHYQLYAAFWLLKEERGDRRGAIEADSMGLGKTTTALLYIALNHFLTANAQHVREFPHLHCRRSQPQLYQQPPDARCPLADRFSIECGCVETSVTYDLGAREGASLILVPASLLGVWKHEWELFGFKRGLGLFIHHRDYPDHAVPRHLWHRVQLQAPPGPGTVAQLAAPDPCVAHRYIVLTTLESYNSRVAGRYFDVPQLVYLKESNSKPQATDRLAWARVVLDESHLRVNFETKAFAILQSLANNGWVAPNFVALTGTPMLRHGLGDMIPVLRIINMISPTLPRNSQFAPFTCPDRLSKMGAQLQVCLHPQGPGSSIFVEEYLDVVGKILALYCIRRHSDSVQNGKKLAYIPPLERYDLVCPPSARDQHRHEEVKSLLTRVRSREWQQRLVQWESTGKDLEDFAYDTDLLLDNIQMVRVISTVPALARHGSKRHLTWKSIERYNWHVYPEQSPFYIAVEQLEASSGKLQQLVEILRLLDSCRTWDGQTEKCVVISEFAIICHVVACVCHRRKIPYQWIHAATPPKERSDIANTFQDLPRHPDTRHPVNPFRVLIGASKLIGQGITLHRAHRLVLMEPSYHASVELQISDRVHRLGSLTDRCSVYRLLNPDSQLEKALVCHQDAQSRFLFNVEWGSILKQTGEGLRS